MTRTLVLWLSCSIEHALSLTHMDGWMYYRGSRKSVEMLPIGHRRRSSSQTGMPSSPSQRVSRSRSLSSAVVEARKDSVLKVTRAGLWRRLCLCW